MPSFHSTSQGNCPFPSPAEDEIYLPERVTHKIPGQEDTGTVEGVHAAPKTGVCVWTVRGPGKGLEETSCSYMVSP